MCVRNLNRYYIQLYDKQHSTNYMAHVTLQSTHLLIVDFLRMVNGTDTRNTWVKIMIKKRLYSH